MNVFGSLGLSCVQPASSCKTVYRLVFYRNAQPFGQVDPILGRDVSFYVFTLPFLERVQNAALTLTIVTLAAVTAAHVVAGALRIDTLRGLSATSQARRHLSVLVAAVLLLLAFGAWLAQASLLTTPSGIVFGASYVDVAARLPLLRVLVVVALLGALMAVAQLFSARLWPVLAAAGLYLIVSLGSSIYAAAVQRFVVAPNEQVRETPYIVHNIQATRRAYGLENVIERELSGDALLSRDDIDRNAATLRNVPLWGYVLTLSRGPW